VGFLVGICAVLVLAGSSRTQDARTPGAEDRQKAEKLFKDVYGAEFDRLLKSTEAAGKVAFVKNLTAAAAEVARDEPALARLIKEKAADLASSDAVSYPLALDLLNGLVPEAPAKLPLLEKIVGLHEKIVRGARATERIKAAEGLVGAYQELAAQQLFDRQPEAAQKTLEKAKQTAGYYLRTSTDLTTELDRQLLVVARELKVHARLQAAQKTLKDNPNDPAANTVLGLHTLLMENKPAQAGPLLARAEDAGVRELGEVMSKGEPGDLAAADAYRAAADAPAAKEFKVQLQARALQHYKAVLEREPKQPEAPRIKLVAAQLAESIPATDPAGKPAAASIFARAGTAIKAGRLADTRHLGGGDEGFRDLPTTGGLLVGFEVVYGEFFNNPVIKSLRPIYLTERGKVTGLYRGYPAPNVRFPPVRVEAKPGYAVGAITVKAGAGIDGFSVTFMKIEGDALNASDSYTTEWLGGKGGGPPTKLAGDGALVVGVFGRTSGIKPPNISLNGLGLIVVPR
jgi:hypothetical protein